MIAGIVVDAYKLPVFERRLKEAKFEYRQGPGLTKGTLLLQVTYEFGELQKLHYLCREADREAKKGGAK